MALEEAFGIEIPDKDADRFLDMSVQDVLNYLESRGIEPKNARRQF